MEAKKLKEEPKQKGYSQEVKDAAKFMYLRRVPVRDIKTQLNLNNTRVVYQWAEKGDWDAMLKHESVEEAASRKLIVLIEKENKTEQDYKDIEVLSNLLDKLAGIDLKKARIAKEKAAAHRQDANGGSRGRKGKKGKNDIGEITAERLAEIREELFYEYQQNWYRNIDQRTRFILKSRQIGATFYFAWEAFENIVLTGDSQIFLSASKNQAMIFKAYICKFALEYFDIKLSGAECISLSKDGKPWGDLRFLSTNASTAQGYSGHLYVDEVFWMPNFHKVDEVATGISSQKKWRTTYFSTPSIKSHSAYPLWSGKQYNEGRKNKVDFDLSHDNLHGGKLCKDKIWRDIVNVEDAQRLGCDLFDIEDLKERRSEAAFNNLFMCAFMEAGASAFKLQDLLDCAVESNVVWVDFKAKQKRPYGNQPVWIGYDPARVGDRSTVVVLAPPLEDNGKFKVLEKLYLKGSFKHQANKIKELTLKYNVQFIGVDCTGPGLGVLDEVKTFYKRVTPIHYTLDTKTRLVLKAIDVIESGRIEWDEEHSDIAQSFLQIHQATTGKDQITYEANRTAATGHADVAWAIMHGLSHEPLTGRKKKASVGL